MEFHKIKVTTVGRFYTVEFILNNEFSIIDDTGDYHHFYIEDKEDNYWKSYTEWFCDIRTERKLKLKIIKTSYIMQDHDII